MLYVHRSERADRLVEALGDLLVEPLAEPLAAEIVAVPTRGVERWVTQRLSHRLGVSSGREDGVCANVDFPFPGVMVGRALARATGFALETDPWQPERSVWPLLTLVDQHLDDAFLQPLADHLRAAVPVHPGRNGAAAEGGTPPPARLRRFATVRHLADLYDHYGVHRPEMLRAWAADRSWPEDGPFGAPAFWQRELWRRLRVRIGVPSPAERLEEAAARLSDVPDLLDLPPRVSLFGLTRLPSSQLAVLKAIGVARDVHLFLLHPSGTLWDKVAAHDPEPPRGLRRATDRTVALAANPLLRSWGRDAREMQVVLAAHGVMSGQYRPVSRAGTSLLSRIQADIQGDRPPPRRDGTGEEDPRLPLRGGDNTLQVHSCHGRARQVEVVRDAILHLLQADSTLEPRDVIVMCPDIETFAPLIHAAFGARDLSQAAAAAPDGAEGGSDVPELRVRLADRSLRQTNPLLSLADFLLELAGGRLTASQVLDLASREPVRRRFRFDDDDLAQIERWVVDMGVRWGLDAGHRARWGLQDLPANTWSAGLDRLLLGVTMAEDDLRLFGGTVPVDDVASDRVELAGRFAELVDRLRGASNSLPGPLPVTGWRDAIASATESLGVAAPADGWQHDQLHRVLDEAVEEAGAVGDAPRDTLDGTRGAPLLDLAEARSLLSHRLKGRPTRANFRTGDLTVCTLVPMRSVPHRVVCLLGLDDGVFPRHGARDGDDLLLDDPWVGDRDGRSEDRQLLLDAVLAATDHLIITFSGRDERTNHERPPAVPIAELLDVVDRTCRLDDPDRAAREAVLVCHPLQSFDPRNYTAGRLGVDGPWSFDPLNLGGARALAGPRRQDRPFLSGRLPARATEVIELDSLVRFLEHPIKAFLRERLGFYAGDFTDDVKDSLPIELDGLDKWEVGDRLLAARLAGGTGQDALSAELARGSLPPGGLADEVLDDLVPTVDALAAAVAALPNAQVEPESLEVNQRLSDGRLLIGTVPGVRGGTIVRCLYSTLAAKHRLAAWARFLALSAARPDLTASAITVGRGRRTGRGATTIRISAFNPLPEPVAVASLDVLVDLYDRGMREPLPVYCATSAAWASAMRTGEEPFDAARREWTTPFDFPFPREDREPEHVTVLGEVAAFDRLLQELPRPDETGAGWRSAESSRFGRLAWRLWDGLLDQEQWIER
jgi:exodeoxyribonuclease V gamma subunit